MTGRCRPTPGALLMGLLCLATCVAGNPTAMRDLAPSGWTPHTYWGGQIPTVEHLDYFDSPARSRTGWITPVHIAKGLRSGFFGQAGIR